MRPPPAGRLRRRNRSWRSKGQPPDTWLGRLAARPGRVLAVGAAVVVLLALGVFRVRYDHNMLHLQAQNLDSVKWEMTLIEHTAGASWHSLSIRDTPEETLALKERFEQLPEVSRAVEVAALVPARPAGEAAQPGQYPSPPALLAQRGAVIPHLRPSGETTCAQALALRQRLQASLVSVAATGHSRTLLTDLAASLDALQQQIWLKVEPEQANVRLQEFDQRMTGDLAEDLHRLREVSNAAPITLDDLPPQLRERVCGPGRQMAAARVRQRQPVGLRTAGALHQGHPPGGPRGHGQTVRHRRGAEGDEERFAARGGLCLPGDRRGPVPRLPQAGAIR